MAESCAFNVLLNWKVLFHFKFPETISCFSPTYVVGTGYKLVTENASIVFWYKFPFKLKEYHEVISLENIASIPAEVLLSAFWKTLKISVLPGTDVAILVMVPFTIL